MSFIVPISTYTACMHTIPTKAGYLLLHVYFMQNTCNTFMHAHINVAGKQANYMYNCTLHTGTLHPTSCHLQTAHVHVYSAFMMWLSACCLCSQCAWWHHSCMEHVFVQWLAGGMPVSSVQCMCMHVGGMKCMQCAACMCVWSAFTWHIDMPEGFIVLVPYLLQNCPSI